MKRIHFLVLLCVVIGAGAGLRWWWTHRHRTIQELSLYGTIEFRQVALAFNSNERISAVLVQEGEYVKRGQILARLDTSRMEPRVGAG